MTRERVNLPPDRIFIVPAKRRRVDRSFRYAPLYEYEISDPSDTRTSI